MGSLAGQLGFLTKCLLACCFLDYLFPVSTIHVWISVCRFCTNLCGLLTKVSIPYVVVSWDQRFFMQVWIMNYEL